MKTLILSGLLLFLHGCHNTYSIPKQNHTLYQVSTIDALLSGIYDGDVKVKELQKHGDFGLGTFNGIDGEMVVYDGLVYQVLSDGSVIKAKQETGVPFAVVHYFTPNLDTTLQNIKSYEVLKKQLNTYTQCKNYPCAFKLHGTFDYIKTRSEPKASKPYPPLAPYIKKNQNFFQARHIKGTLIGYALPAYFKKINIVGYHFHFISDDKTFGGHVLDLTFKKAHLSLDKLYNMQLNLLRTEEFEKKTLKSRKGAVCKVER